MKRVNGSLHILKTKKELHMIGKKFWFVFFFFLFGDVILQKHVMVRKEKKTQKEKMTGSDVC